MQEILGNKFFIVMFSGRMAQWLRHPPTERGIPGSNPGVIGLFFFPSVLFLSAYR